MRATIAQTTFDRANLALLAAIVALGGFSLWREGYASHVHGLFVVVAAILGLLACAFAAFSISRRRLVALAFVAALGGYLTQLVGASHLGAWRYPAPAGTYAFVPATFVVASLVCYGLAQTTLLPLLRRVARRAPHPLHALVPLALLAFLVVQVLARGGRPDATFWVYYGALGLTGAYGALAMELPLLLAILVAGALVGTVAEVAGAASGLWSFTAGPGWRPPAWLVLASWPLEVTAHFTLAALLAREAIGARPRYFVEPRVFALHPQHPLFCGTRRQRVVSAAGDDKLALLRSTLERAGLADALARRCAALGRTPATLKVVIKPNFMFMYSEHDRSTFTDPELVEALVDWLAERGYTDVTLVEAQSAYGNYFEGREVPRVAEVVGYRPRGRYRIVDLTVERVPHVFPGPLGDHFVGPTWRDADFRVSFAKNKTHTWAWYTLCIKNVYGTLPLQDKIHEYHYRREIYYPTIETLLAFPVHFAIIDAFVSADGPFGIFADKAPNPTRTIIAGEHLVAVDWVGASKMGLDPMVSRYMQLAVQALGRPDVDLVGDASIYEPWVNVPRAMIELWDNAEEHLGFTNTVFSALNHDYMSPAFPPRPRARWMAWLGRLAAPLGGLVYQLPRRASRHGPG